MNDIVFLLTKGVGLALKVETAVVIGLLAALFAVLRRAHRASVATVAGTLGLVVAVTTLPIGEVLLTRLEAQWPPAQPLQHLDGIVVLGGFEELRATARWGTPQVNTSAERLIATAALAAAHPQARIVISGGSAHPSGFRSSTRLPQVAQPVLTSLGVREDRILWEDRSRNTAENAAFTLELLGGPPEGEWVLVTSAFHMDRALRSFAAAGWPGIQPWPVDYRSGEMKGAFGWSLASRIGSLNIALKEWVGRIGYWQARR